MTKQQAFRLLRLARLAQADPAFCAADAREFLNLAQQALSSHPDSLEAMRLLRLARATAGRVVQGAGGIVEARQA
jgi:hypothetical protein